MKILDNARHLVAAPAETAEAATLEIMNRVSRYDVQILWCLGSVIRWASCGKVVWKHLSEGSQWVPKAWHWLSGLLSAQGPLSLSRALRPNGQARLLANQGRCKSSPKLIPFFFSRTARRCSMSGMMVGSSLRRVVAAWRTSM